MREMSVLYVTPYVPSCIRTRPYNLIRALLRLGHQVTLVTAAGTSSEEQGQVQELESWGMQVEVFPVPLVRSLVNCLLALPTREPLQAVYAYHPDMARRLGELAQNDAFDIVHIEHLRAARLAQAIRNARPHPDPPPSEQGREPPPHSGGGIPVVYDSVDCISLLFEQAVQSGAQLRSRLMTAVDLARTRRYEAQLLTRYDRVVVTSQRDKEALERLAGRYLPPGAQPSAITVVTNGVDLEYFRPGVPSPSPVPTGEDQGGGEERDGRTVVFTGKMSYHANVAAALYFAQEVLPHVWAGDPSVRFQIVGKDPPEAIRRLAADERIQVTGTVDDLRPYLSGATVAVCPALYAVGIQNKVLEAMAMGAPVVSTPAGCAALAAEVGRDVLVAEGEEAFAAAVLRVCSDPALAQGLAAAGRRYVEEYHSWEAGARRLVEVYEQALHETNERRI